jgi:hypothetical protein
MVQFSITTVILAFVIIFLHLSHDLKFMPQKTPANGTNSVAGILTMVLIIIVIEIFKNYSTGKYDMLDGISVIIATLIAATALYLILHSLLYEKKEPGVHDKVPIAFQSGFAFAGMGAFFYFFFLTDPFSRPEAVFYLGILMCVLGGLAVFFNQLDNTYFAPKWATKKHMNLVSGMILCVILFLILIVALTMNSEPYEIWDTLRIVIVASVSGFGTYAGMFATAL